MRRAFGLGGDAKGDGDDDGSEEELHFDSCAQVSKAERTQVM